MSNLEESERERGNQEKGRRASIAFPKNTLKQAIRMAQSIQDNNAGEPYNRLDLAQSLGWSPESSAFRTLITSSNRYGLIKGGYKAEKIALTDLGKAIVAPRSDKERNEGIVRALKNVDIFGKFLERFDQKKLPRDDLLKNTFARDFNIPNEDVDNCVSILRTNLEDFGILVGIGDNVWVRLDRLSVTKGTKEGVTPEREVEETPQGLPVPEGIPPKIVNPIMFVSHSRNKRILDQIKDMLEFGQFKYVVAEEVETTSIPIPEKIFGLMRDCNCAIINISADEKEKNPDGSYRVNPNVLTEIGAAFLAYNRRVILLTDRRVSVPSNLQGLYRSEYEGDELSYDAAMKLQKSLLKFREMF